MSASRFLRLREILAAILWQPLTPAPAGAIVEQPADCPLPDCSTCQPAAPPLDVVAELERCQDRQREIGRAFWWLLDAMPDVWQHRSFAERAAVAERIVQLRAREIAERQVRP